MAINPSQGPFNPQGPFGSSNPLAPSNPFTPSQGGPFGPFNPGQGPLQPPGSQVPPPPGALGPGGVQPPSSPPPSFTPQISSFAVDPFAIAGCLFRNTYIWQRNGDQYWFYPIFVGRTSVSGFRFFFGIGWRFFGVDLRAITSFACF
ncbi:hypothetical protein [Paenibacillus tuaregi]|uniref:hypothetical protein n=1 Tax=Paenibacillus tuaregi TaxID=1816681 RepID=UPI000839AC62|nr:hypothetical protein [Paenibacillus tuaregi]